jgi:hypothetical protein
VIGTYPVGVPFRLELAFEMDRSVYSVWIDDERVSHRRPFGVEDRGLGRINVGVANDPDYDGRLRLDNLKVHTLLGAPTPVEERSGIPDAIQARLLGAAPNPFNPRTQIRFVLPVPATMRLDIVDLRGRLVANLMDGTLAAGEHVASWEGTDATGRFAASGVYRALLTVNGRSQAVPLTLLK